MPSSSRQVWSPRGARSGPPRTGFTVTELLVSVGVIGVLIGILLPALLRTRDAGRGVVCLANLRGVVQTLDHYRFHHQDEYPFAQRGTPFPTDPERHGFVTTSNHWDLEIHWPALVQKTAPWREHFGSWVCPGSERKPGAPWEPARFSGVLVIGGSSYRYSNSFVARPELWDGRTAAVDALLRPTRGSEVRSPSRKAIFYDHEMAHVSGQMARESRPVAFPDGHAALRRIRDARHPVPNPLKGGTAERLHDTPRGVLGWDF